ncbi:MAG: GNAT family N-acetyltransferase [Pseudonocardia sp.]|nr:GNAT family N-acetyltransferase [Pseudonocardia sp.]
MWTTGRRIRDGVPVGLSGWTVCTATVADAEAIGALHVRSWRHAYRGIVPDAVLAALDPAERADRWRETLRSPGSHRVFVAVGDGSAGPRLGAFCAVGPVRDARRDGWAGARTGELYALYADPDAFGRGAGPAAHRAGVDRLRAAGHRCAVLWVLTENARARSFYARHGWHDDEMVEEHQHVGVGLSVVRYSRWLTLTPGVPGAVVASLAGGAR